jgi:hypothetical protein
MIKARANEEINMSFRLKITGSYFITVFLSYCIMLVIMSFNGGAFFSVILGLSIGNNIFSYQKKMVLINERNLQRIRDSEKAA